MVDIGSVMDRIVTAIRSHAEDDDRKLLIHMNDGTVLSAIFLRLCIKAVGAGRVVSLSLPHLSAPGDGFAKAVIGDTGVKHICVPVTTPVIELWKHLENAGIHFDKDMHKDLVEMTRDTALISICDGLNANASKFLYEAMRRGLNKKYITPLCKQLGVREEDFSQQNA